MTYRAFLMVTVLFVATSAEAQRPLGPEIQVNTYTTDDQGDPAVCQDSAGNFVVAWAVEDTDDTDGVFARRYTSSGAALGSEFPVNSVPDSGADQPAICCHESGSFVVVWRDEDGDSDGVFGQRFTSAGTLAGTEFQVNTYTTDLQEDPDISCGPNGSFVVAWESNEQDEDGSGIFGQRYDGAGMPAGSEFLIPNGTGDQQLLPALCGAADGSFVVAWESNDQLGDENDDIFVRRYASDGTPVGSEFQVNTYTTGDQEIPDICCDPSGGFVVVWESYGQVDGNDVFGQRFDSTGEGIGSEFRVNNSTTGSQSAPEVCCGGSGSFVVAWTDGAANDGDDDGVFGRRFSGTGAAQGSEFQVNTYTTGDQDDPDISCAPNGQFIVVWEGSEQDGDGTGVFAQRLTGDALSASVPALSLAGLAVGALVLLGAAARALARLRT